MSLVDKLKSIAKTEGIALDESKINEVSEIMNKHKEHGDGYRIKNIYDLNGNLLELSVQCNPKPYHSCDQEADFLCGELMNDETWLLVYERK